MLKTNETGRSMVEMLGVLAVMGVLSVSGVAMYTTAMNKHRANELLNAVSMRATALASQRMSGRALSLSGFTDNTQGTSVINVNSENTDAIEITITNVPVAVCKNLYSTKGANVVEMKSGTTVLNNASACVEGATVSIKFNNDLSKSSSSSGTGGNSGNGSGNQQQGTPTTATCSQITTDNTCNQAGCNWCQYNSTCQETACPSPASFSTSVSHMDQAGCEAAGYKWCNGYGCGLVDCNCSDCHYICNSSNSSFYVRSREDCPSEMYQTQSACVNAGYTMYCDTCVIGPGGGPC